MDRGTLRKRIDQLILSDADLDAFCLDHFYDIHLRFSAGMNRIEKVNLLLQLVPSLGHLATLLDSMEESRRNRPQTQPREGVVQRRGSLPRIAAAAAVLLGVSLATGLYYSKHLSSKPHDSGNAAVPAGAMADANTRATVLPPGPADLAPPARSGGAEPEDDGPEPPLARLVKAKPATARGASSSRPPLRISRGQYDTEKVDIVSNSCDRSLHSLQLDGLRDVSIDGDLISISSKDHTVQLGRGRMNRAGGFANLNAELTIQSGDCVYHSKRQSKITITGDDRFTLHYFEERSDFRSVTKNSCKFTNPCNLDIIFYMQK